MAELVSAEPTCGQLYGTRSRSGHPCGRPASHDFADELGCVCRCEAEAFCEQHAPCVGADDGAALRPPRGMAS